MLKRAVRARWLAALGSVIVCVSFSARQTPVASDDEPPPIKRAVAPPPGPYAPGFDALHYDIALDLPLTGTLISGVTTIRVALREPRSSILPLDLTGLAVDRVRVDATAATFTYNAGKLRVPMPSSAAVGDTVDV